MLHRGYSRLIAVASVACIGTLSAQAQIATSAWYNVIGKSSGKCVDARAAGTANDTAVQQFACNGTTAQQWQLQTTSGGYYRVNARNAVGQAWDVSGVSLADAAAIHLWAYGGGNNQQWLPVAEGGGTYHLIARHSGKCLDVPGNSSADAVQLQQFACNGSGAQSFRLQQVGAGPTPTTPPSGGGGRAQSTFITSYGYNDNDDGNGHFGTAVIAYPSSQHPIATEGSGAFNDPVSFATDPREIAPHTIIYVPHVRKYFVMDDGCAECTTDWNSGKWHIDLFMGPNNALQPEPALDNCEGSVTRNATIFISPGAGYPVDTQKMFQNGQCTVHIY
jgi:Ricin-type beta-trefoil lectin domain